VGEAVKIVVTGIGGPAGKAVATYLLKLGHEVIATDCNPEAGKTAVADEFEVVPPASKEREFIDQLLGVVDEHQAQFLICTVTEEVPVVAEYVDLLSNLGCQTCIADPNAAVLANDKMMSAFHMHAAGVGVPKTHTHNPSKFMVELLGMPCLSKPRWGRGGKGVIVHETVESVLAIPNEPEVVFQEFLSGVEHNVAMFVDDDQTITALVVMRKLALREGNVGNALAVEVVEDDEVATLAIDAVRALGLTGPVDVDIREGGGKLGVLEVNPRVGATVLYAPEVLDALMRYAERTVKVIA
jgi:carbamoylphosphate synthase large subunit